MRHITASRRELYIEEAREGIGNNRSVLEIIGATPKLAGPIFKLRLAYRREGIGGGRGIDW